MAVTVFASPSVYVIGRDNAKPFLIADLPDGNKVVTMQPLSYTIPDRPEFGRWRGLEVYIPAGFISDYASVPRLFWRLIPRRGKYNKAAFIHDYLYVILKVPRKISDRIFYAAMRELGVGNPTAWLIYRAVRAGGWIGWTRNHRERMKYPVRLRLKYGLATVPDLQRPVDHPEWEFASHYG